MDEKKCNNSAWCRIKELGWLVLLVVIALVVVLFILRLVNHEPRGNGNNTENGEVVEDQVVVVNGVVNSVTESKLLVMEEISNEVVELDVSTDTIIEKMDPYTLEISMATLSDMAEGMRVSVDYQDFEEGRIYVSPPVYISGDVISIMQEGVSIRTMEGESEILISDSTVISGYDTVGVSVGGLTIADIAVGDFVTVISDYDQLSDTASVKAARVEVAK
ncbi:hypothetical protein KJ855_03890 [Patescibacteria group bacterium]|nr:hypothetical protein [Patescibacteria group bacterium]